MWSANCGHRRKNGVHTRESYSISHDLRSPLVAIKGFSSILLEDYSDILGDQGADLLKRISNSCGKMGTLIDGMLNLAADYPLLYLT